MSKFFSKYDWAAFWMTTLVTFGVYFFTLGPSVGLEDSGELATASAHLGVPHPPGYPFWTFCTWIFCRVFSFVTYMGHPTPAWAVSLCSAVFGAFAAGCTAMLICRSAQDFIAPFVSREPLTPSPDASRRNLSPSLAAGLCFAGGVGGALTFAFSPVEWSQSTIVEIYSLNALCLMLVFLLSYRWMCRPSDRILWATAFVFGLGLTNYQVLLFAIVPLAIVIAFRNIRMFRDFALYLIPVLLTYQVLQVGELGRAQTGMSHDVIAKHAPVGCSDSDYAVELLWPYYLRCIDDGARQWDRRVASLSAQTLASDRTTNREILGVKRQIDKLTDGLEDCIDDITDLQGSDVERTYEYKKHKFLFQDRLDKLMDARKRLEALTDARMDADGFIGVLGTVGESVSGMPWDRKAQLLKEDDRRRKDAERRQKGEDVEKKPTVLERAHTERCPSGVGVTVALVVFLGAMVAALLLQGLRRSAAAWMTAVSGFGVSAFGLFLSATVLASPEVWVDSHAEAFLHDASVSGLSLATAPLIEPSGYVYLAILLLGSAAMALASTFVGDTDRAPLERVFLMVSGAFALAAIGLVFVLAPSVQGLPELFGCTGQPYPWAKSTLIFGAFIVALFALSAFVKRGLAYAIPVAGFHIAVFLLLARGAMNGLTHPASWWFWWPLVWNFVVFALVWRVLPHGKSVVGAAFFAQLGAAFYAYMPIVSELRNPPMNWGYPRTWEGFKHAIAREQYEQIKAEAFVNAKHFLFFLREQVGYYIRDVKLQFTDFLAAFAIVPFACWQVRARRRTVFRALWVAVVALVVWQVAEAFGVSPWGDAPFAALALIRLPLLLLVVLALSGLLLVLVRQFVYRPMLAARLYVDRCLRRSERMPVVALAVLAAVLVLLPTGLYAFAGGSGTTALALVLVAVVLGGVYAAVPVLRRAFRRMRRSVGAVAFEGPNVSHQWLLASAACFLMMSFLLILLAKVQGDVQDGFIQKVKFISSHAMIAMWIGYGLIATAVMALLFIPARLRRWVVLPLVLAVVLVAALPPLVQNYTNGRLVVELGGAEQNGHTFGWQFGAYQLDGAKAIRAQVTADEEPLPDPDWPRPMEDHAVFFGGTDPGRFVPTYMIYTAQFRPDVYLITQNALADDTYMSVERDLYGDEIWIPAKEDNGAAFTEFISNLTPEEERQYGVDKSNGRVQVTGATSVMKINELLVKKMFEENRARHAFYVEESYPIDWMYDYLVPHGLIMKLEPRPTETMDAAAWADTLAKDRDFWDWYTRRLLDDPMFARDFAAQKSFAKLRTAIGGLLMNRVIAATQARSASAHETLRVLLPNFEQPFREACLLGPISPESTFRYLSMLQMSCALRGERKFDQVTRNIVEELLTYLDENDPYSMRTLRYWPMVERDSQGEKDRARSH